MNADAEGVKIGLRLPHFGTDLSVEALTEVARIAEDLDFASVWVSDHLVLPREYGSKYPFQPSGRFPVPPGAMVFEPLVTLAYVAAVTRRVQLGIASLVVPHRPPALAAKMLTTLDFLSAGRLLLSVGTGWLREEFAVLGAPYEDRSDFTDEAMAFLRCVTAAGEGAVSFNGRYVSARDVFIQPAGPQGRELPIWVTGNGDRACAAVAAYGDAWHFHLYGAEPAHIRSTVADIARRVDGARPIGLSMYLPIQFAETDPDPGDESTKPWMLNTLAGTAAYIIDVMRTYRELGVDHFVMRIGDPSRTTETQAIERFVKEVRPFLS